MHSTPKNYRDNGSTGKFRSIVTLSAKLISMGETAITLLFGEAFVVLSLGAAATFWFLLRSKRFRNSTNERASPK